MLEIKLYAHYMDPSDKENIRAEYV